MKVICNKASKYAACRECDHGNAHEPHLEPGFVCTRVKGCSMDEGAICEPINTNENEQ